MCTSFLTSTLLLEDVSIVSGSSRVVVFVFDFVLGLNSGATGVEEETNEVFLDLKNEVMPDDDEEVEEEGGVVEFFFLFLGFIMLGLCLVDSTSGVRMERGGMEED